MSAEPGGAVGAGRAGGAGGPVLPASFRRFWWGEAVSGFGSAVTLLALQTLVVVTLGETAVEVGWLSAATWLPYLVLGLVVGALVDRVRRRPVMVATDAVRAVLLALVPLAHLTGLLSLPLLVAVAQTAGPAVAGLLVRLLGAPLAVLVDAATYVFSATVVASLREVEEPRPAHLARLRRRDLPADVAEGLRWVYTRSGLVRLAVATHVWFAAQAVLVVVVAPYALLRLRLTPLELGLVYAVAGVGALVGTWVTTALGRRLGTGVRDHHRAPHERGRRRRHGFGAPRPGRLAGGGPGRLRVEPRVRGGRLHAVRPAPAPLAVPRGAPGVGRVSR